ncbi:MAG: hypothetical protein KJ945_07260 [Gammaproteobacteria bacterium]|nr:hypothetical protein [Gammaproteobacteria bacterium]MBU0837114.1 hypothetical protein [Gammaproteobacteria bacterium]MBU1807022.1 hypothetical protein [Gammaproteobacteria bacterium]
MKSPKDILALGQAIVRELELDDRGEVLQRWLAHHLAELITEAERADGTAKGMAQQRAVELVLKLWTHRRALPERVDPLGGYREAISVLSRLKPEANPWARFRQIPGRYDEALQEMFATLSRTVLSGLVLTTARQTRPIRDAELDALEDEELFLSQELSRWMPNSRDAQVLPIKITLVGADEDTDGEGWAEGQQSEALEEPSPESHAHQMVLQNLECFQEELGALIDRWRNSAPESESLDDESVD